MKRPCLYSILDMVRRNNYRILNLVLKLPTGFKRRDLDIALVHAVKAGFYDCAKVDLRGMLPFYTLWKIPIYRMIVLLCRHVYNSGTDILCVLPICEILFTAAKTIIDEQ